jgi:ABC-type branched-subunit amino acid transport system substrate-binding protein
MRSRPLSPALFLTMILLLVACAAPGEAPPTPPDSEFRVTIGFTVSQTGGLSVESSRQANGLNLWMKQVNDAGGIQLKDGSAVKFNARYYDDESTKDRVQQLYTRLATKDNATFLISPYSSNLTDAAAVIAEQYGKIMISTGAASDSTYKRGFTLVYQAYTPASKYLVGAVDLLNATDPSAKRLAIIHENDKNSTDVANAVNAYAIEQGYEVVFFEGYDTGTTDFAPFINKIDRAAPDAILGGGHFQDGSTFAKQLYEKEVAAKMVALLVAPAEDTFAQIGDAARGIIGPSQWEPQVNFTAESAEEADLPFVGPDNADFVRDFREEYEEEPSYHAAGGYAAGLILQYAIESAGSLDTQELKAVLDSMSLSTFFGHIRFDASEDNHGLQIGHSMVYVQWQKDASALPVKQVVWPPEGVTAQIIYPLR